MKKLPAILVMINIAMVLPLIVWAIAAEGANFARWAVTPLGASFLILSIILVLGSEEIVTYVIRGQA